MYALLTEATDGSFALPVRRVVNSLDRETVESDGHVVALRYLTPAQRRAFGWYDFAEEAVDAALYWLGAPLDALDGDVVRRSYPDKQVRPRLLPPEINYRAALLRQADALAAAGDQTGALAMRVQLLEKG